MSRPWEQWVAWAGFVAGPAAAIVAFFALPESYTNPSGEVVAFSRAGRVSAAIGVWMAVWWLTEAVHITVTALLPVTMLPVLGAMPLEAAAARYAHELIFLFMGGFLLSLAMQRWGLHRRMALTTVRAVGTQPHLLIGGFMLVTAFLSMWVSNTATTLVMLPIATSVLGRLAGDERSADPRTRRLSICLMLAIAYAASIGGVGTIIGTPPNGVLVGYLRDNRGVEISFLQWLRIGLPLVGIFLPVAWVLLTCVLYPISPRKLAGAEGAIERPGPVSRGEKVTAAVFAAAVVGWVFRPLITDVEIAGEKPFADLTDTGVAMLAGVALFVIPVRPRRREFAMDWATAAQLPWGILILFGGGLSLARALEMNGVGVFLGSQVEALADAPEVALTLSVVALVILLTELTSNTATTATLVPILAGFAPALGVHAYALIFPAAFAASCAFMMPVATPPNAIVFASGHVNIRHMAGPGLVLNLIGIALITWLIHAWVLPTLLA